MATWAVADPATSPATVTVLTSGMGHEMAILGAPSWVGTGAGRRRFAQQLTRRVEAARDENLAVSSLIFRNNTLDDHLDLLVKRGITAVRPGQGGAARSAKLPQPGPLRYGVWAIPAAAVLPAATRWFGAGIVTHAAQRAIDRAVAYSATLHLAIDGPRMLERPEAGLKLLESMLRHASQRREEGRLELQTLAAAASTLSQLGCVIPLRSILRPAA